MAMMALYSQAINRWVLHRYTKSAY